MQVTINNELTVEVVPNEEHEWLLSTKDVAEGYGLTEQAVRMVKQRNSDELEEGVHYLTVTDRDAQNITGNPKTRSVTMWTKEGVVIMGMFIKTPIAKEFRRWATKYIVEGQGNTKPAFALPDFSNPAEAARAWADQYEKVVEYHQQLQIQAPKVETYDAIMDSTGLFNMSDAAKTLGVRPQLFPKYLSLQGVLFKRSSLSGKSSYRPHQQYVDSGYFRLIPRNTRGGGSTTQLMVTPKGLEWMRKFIDDYYLWVYTRNEPTIKNDE